MSERNKSTVDGIEIFLRDQSSAMSNTARTNPEISRNVVIVGKGSCSQNETGNQLMEAGQLLKASFTSDMTDRRRSLSAGPLDVHSSSGPRLPGSMGVARSPLHPPVSSPVPLQMSQNVEVKT